MRLELSPGFEDVVLNGFRQNFERGNKDALIQAIRFCFDQELVAPKWVVSAFFSATNRWYQLETKELGAALGLAWPKGKNLSAARKRRRLTCAVLIEIIKATESGHAIDDELFASVGKKFNIGKTLAKQYYREDLVHFPSLKPPSKQRRKK